MKLAILSRGRNLYSTRRLVSTARQRGHEVRIIDPFRCVLTIGPNGRSVLCEGDSLDSVDCFIPRVGSSTADPIAALLRHLDDAGPVSLNGPDAIQRSRDKFSSLQELAAAGLPVPYTAITRHEDELPAAIAAVGGAPVILKLREGTQGVGVMKADSVVSAKSIIHALWSLEQSVLVQEFIAESSGTDVRAFIVDGKVVGAMSRRALDGDFRSNLHLGGRAARVTLSREMRDVSVASAEVFGLRVAGVDLLLSSRGPLVTEVNPSPGLEGIEGITGLDVAKSIIRTAEGLVLSKRRGELSS